MITDQFIAALAMLKVRQDKTPAKPMTVFHSREAASLASIVRAGDYPHCWLEIREVRGRGFAVVPVTYDNHLPLNPI